jgi:hypothetical protein
MQTPTTTTTTQVQKLQLTALALVDAQELLHNFIEKEKNQNTLCVAICQGVIEDLRAQRGVLTVGIEHINDPS